jgi:uncharacterized protein YdeI (BOF family)
MKKQAGAIVVSILFAVGTAVAAYAADASPPVQGSKAPIVKEGAKVKEGATATPEGGAPHSVVTGELLKIDGKDYLVKDQSGKEVKIQLDEKTLMNAQPKVGDKIMAKVEPKGNAYSINLASDSTEAGTLDKQTGPPSKSDQPEPSKNEPIKK